METSTMNEEQTARDEAFKLVAFPVSLVSIPHPTLKPGADGKQPMIPGRMAVMRDDNNDVLNIVSKKYPLVPHIDVFGAMDEAIAQIGVPVINRKVSTAYGGGYAKVIWTLDRPMDVYDPDGFRDSVKVQVHARNSYNYSSLVGLELGTLRQICSNGMMAGKLLKSARKRHVPSIKVPELVKEIAAVIETTEKLISMFGTWNKIEYNRDRFVKWLDARPLPKKGRTEILDYFTAQPDRVQAGGAPRYSGWEAFNALTWFATHRVTSRRSDTRLFAEERILELAEVFSREELEAVAVRRSN